jgi:hypothetical protein
LQLSWPVQVRHKLRGNCGDDFGSSFASLASIFPDLWRAKPESRVPMHLKELLNEVALVAAAFLGRSEWRLSLGALPFRA